MEQVGNFLNLIFQIRGNIYCKAKFSYLTPKYVPGVHTKFKKYTFCPKSSIFKSLGGLGVYFYKFYFLVIICTAIQYNTLGSC